MKPKKSQVWNQVRIQVRIQVYDQVEVQVWNQAMEITLVNKMEEANWRTKILFPIATQADIKIKKRLRDKTWIATYYSSCDEITFLIEEKIKHDERV